MFAGGQYMKKVVAQLMALLVLSMYVHTIPMDEWDTLSKPEKKERLRQGIEVIKRELGCEHPSITLDIDEQYLYVYGECDNGKNIGYLKRGQRALIR
jgi:hypothetical protein